MIDEKETGAQRFFKALCHWAYKYVGGLFMEDKGDGKKVVSIGRCLLISIVLWLFWFWSDWSGAMTITADALAAALVSQLPEGAEISGVDILAASTRVVDALPTAAPPMLETAFLTMCGYVFGSKITGAVAKRLNGGR